MNAENRIEKEAAKRLPYSSPQLMSYGAVRDLTTGGSKGAAEGKKGSASKKKS